MSTETTARRHAFTLIELLIVVAIIAILAAIGMVNLRLAMERARKSADAANMKTIAAGLQLYLTDFGRLPPADRLAGPFMSHQGFGLPVGNGPAAGGSWDGVPWLLVEYRYVSNWQTLFTPKYLKLYPGGKTLGNTHPRFHNFRYAYNSSAISTGGHAGGFGNIESGEVWMVRNLWLGPQMGWHASAYPNFPADYRYPWGEGDDMETLEHAMYADFRVRTVIGGTDTAAPGWPQ
ncbi:MAG: prepilin-type N-terminal cleavage/methylation domain-containing protein [Candidatus Sumerlaeia bacterium]|nr:prepilin-type N-terminal cleavage/methylation domain-containing protein [Candidatus Sumerlaeia bacterium]